MKNVSNNYIGNAMDNITQAILVRHSIVDNNDTACDNLKHANDCLVAAHDNIKHTTDQINAASDAIKYAIDKDR